MSTHRPIVHISDFHFDASEERELSLQSELRRVALHQPRLVILTGDLTSAGTDQEFAAVARVLEPLGDVPVVLVPGNRDLPELELREMMLSDDEDEGTDKWREVKSAFGSLETAPLASNLLELACPSPVTFQQSFGACNTFHSDEHLCVVGLNTNRKVSRGTLDAAARIFRNAAPGALRLLATHHPFVPVPNRPWEANDDMPRNAGDLLRIALECKVQVACSGHLHRSHVGVIGLDGRSMQLSMAPTLIYRTKKKDRGFHVLREGDIGVSIEAVHTHNALDGAMPA